MTKRTAVRVIGISLIAAALAATLAINYFTISHIWRGRTRVPWADEWEMIHEFMLYKHGSPLFPILWSSYWGHRLVIPRLVFFANLQWASGHSLTWLTFVLQTFHVTLLCALSWILVGRKSRTLFAVLVTVNLNLMFSPAQMENFVWSMQFLFPLVYAAASAAFVCLALHRESGRGSLLLLCVAAAAVASYTAPDGLLVWPVLVAQAICLKLERRVTNFIAILGAAIIASYCGHYQTASFGMGIAGMLRHPVDAIGLVALLLGSALNGSSRSLAIAVVLLALAGAIYSAAKALKKHPGPPSHLSALMGMIVFFLLSAASIVAGRLTPQWLSGTLVIPSRYFTLIESFWAALAILLVYVFRHKSRSPVLAGCYVLLYLCLMFFRFHAQRSSAEDWSGFFRGADAVGAAFLVDAPDETLLDILWPLEAQRSEIVSFLRQQHLSVFGESRAQWQGRSVSELFPAAVPDRCIGGIERSLSLQDSAWRVEGWAWDRPANRTLDYLLIADPTGLVVGMARGGFRHHYFPGFFVETPVIPVSHMRFLTSEWLGYVRQPLKTPWTIYGLLPGTGQICMIESEGN